MASCPNIKSPEWKALVAEVGEFQAYALFTLNNFEIPTSKDISKVYDLSFEERKDILSLKGITEIREKILAALTGKVSIYSSKEEYVKNLKKLIDDFVKADVTQSLMMVSDQAVRQIETLSKKMDEVKDDLPTVVKMREFIGVYEILEEFATLLEGHALPKFILDNPDVDIQKLRNQLAYIQSSSKNFHKKYLTYAKNTMVNILAKESTIVRATYKEKFQKEFNTQNPEPKNSEAKQIWLKKRLDYVNNSINDINDRILAEEKQYIYQILQTGPKDLGWLTSWVSDSRNMNDTTIQLVTKLLDNADYKADQQFIQARNSLLKVWEEFKNNSKAKGIVITNQKELYKDILEEDAKGNLTGNITRKYSQEFYDYWNQIWKEYYDLKKQITKASLQKDFKLARDLDIKSRKLIVDARIKTLIDPKAKDVYDDYDNVKEEYRNKNFIKLLQDPNKLKMYNALIEFNKESDKLVPMGQRLLNRLPAMSSVASERLTDITSKKLSIGDTFSRWKNETFSFTEDETEYGELGENNDTVKVLSTSSGRTFRTVFLPFRKPIDSKFQSYDVIGLALSNRAASLNYYHKKSIQMDLEVIRDIIHDRPIYETASSGKYLVGKSKNFAEITGEEQAEILKTTEGQASKMYKVLESILDDRLYGKHNIPNKFKFVDKMATNLVKVSADMMLVTNWLGGMSNWVNGHTMAILAAVGGKVYNKTNLIHAEAKYLADSGHMLLDFESLVPHSLTNLLTEKFLGTSLDFNPLDNSLTKDTRVKRFFTKKNLYAANKLGEHYIQSVMTYAVLDNIKIMSNGKYMTKDGTLTDNREDGISVVKGFIKTEKGLEWGNKNWTIEGFSEFNEDAEFYISRKLKDVVADFQGQYDPRMQSMFQRTAAGKLVMFMRKWMVKSPDVSNILV